MPTAASPIAEHRATPATRPLIGRLDLRGTGGVCAVLTTLGLVAGVVVIASTGGPQDVLPGTGAHGRAWLQDVHADRAGFEVGTSLVIAAGLLGMVAFVAMFDALRETGTVLIVAPVLGIVGLLFVTLSHAVPIALAAGEPVADFDTAAAAAHVLNAIGNGLTWGAAVPLYALGMLAARTVPRWISWLGLAVAAFGGWLGLLGPLAPVFDAVSTVGLLGFLVWMPAVGVVLIRAPASSLGER
jgi:hypothetical protein